MPDAPPALSAERLAALLQTDPMSLGYAAVGWTAPLLSAHLRRSGERASLCARTMRERLHAAGLAWKRPRYVFSQKEPHRAQKKEACFRRLRITVETVSGPPRFQARPRRAKAVRGDR